MRAGIPDGTAGESTRYWHGLIEDPTTGIANRHQAPPEMFR